MAVPAADKAKLHQLLDSIGVARLSEVPPERYAYVSGALEALGV